MDRKECANGLELIKVAAIKLKGNFSTAFMGAFAMTAPLILEVFLGILFAILFNNLVFLTAGIILFVISVAPLQMGYMKFFNDMLDGKQPRLRVVYSYIRFSAITLRAIYISGLLIIMYLVGGILWLIPAGFAISAFSMVLFFLQKFEHERLSVVMKECCKKMIGNRLAMFSYKLIFYFVYFMLFVVAALFLLLVYNLLPDSLFVSWIVAVCGAIVFIFLYTMVTVYFHSSNQIFFEDVLSRDEKKRQRKAHIAKDTVEQHHVEEKKDEDVKESKVETETKHEEQIVTEDKKKSVETKKTKSKTSATKKTTKTVTKKTTTKKEK